MLPPTNSEMMSDSLVLVEALYNIVHESQEAETVRSAVFALTNTESGRAYLRAHPLTQ